MRLRWSALKDYPCFDRSRLFDSRAPTGRKSEPGIGYMLVRHGIDTMYEQALTSRATSNSELAPSANATENLARRAMDSWK